MPSHNQASLESKKLCEQLLKEMQVYLPETIRSEASNTCGIYVPGRNRFAYIYHRSKGGFVRCYFRGDVSVKPSFQTGLTVNVRPKSEKGWDKEFPYYIEIKEPELLPKFAKLLFTNSYPLSKKKRHRDSSAEIPLPEEISQNELHLSEGKVKTIDINKYERNATARKICIEHYGLQCQICKFDFLEVYGPLGEGLIHVHHLKPLSEIGERYQVDPIVDLVPLCPNCHAVVHWKNDNNLELIKTAFEKYRAEQGVREGRQK